MACIEETYTVAECLRCSFPGASFHVLPSPCGDVTSFAVYHGLKGSRVQTLGHPIESSDESDESEECDVR